jgi:hypothetical protein
VSAHAYGLSHPTWGRPDCFFYDTADDAAGAILRVYGENSGHVVIGPVTPPARDLTEALTRALGCEPGTRENDGTPCASGLHSPALWGADGCTWVAEVAECLGEMGVGGC